MEINDKNYKYKAKRAYEAEDRLVMGLVVEALDYTNANKEDTIIDIDVEKLRLLEMGKKFIQEYIDYLNK